MNNLNIYKVSGIAKVGYTDKVYYWLAGTNDLENTRAMNYVLSVLNLANTKLSVVTDTNTRIELMNRIDLYTLILDGLLMAKQSDIITVQSVGNVISNMIVDNMFNSITDNLTTRTNNLDALIVEFNNRINNISDNLDTNIEFDEWFKLNIIDEDYNDTPQDVIDNYISVMDKVGSSSGETLAQKLSDSGPCYLYMFMTDKQINVCNSIIQRRYNQELKNWSWYTRICRQAYSKETIRNLYENGCTLHYNMTPEDKIDELFAYNEQNGGVKIGNPLVITAIISAVVSIVGLLISVYYLVKDVYKLTYEEDDDYKSGVPDQSADGWDFGEAVDAAKAGQSLTDPDVSDKGKGKSNTLLLIGVAALGLLMLIN